MIRPNSFTFYFQASGGICIALIGQYLPATVVVPLLSLLGLAEGEDGFFVAVLGEKIEFDAVEGCEVWDAGFCVSLRYFSNYAITYVNAGFRSISSN